MNPGYADRCGNPIPHRDKEKQSAFDSTVTTQTWTREQMQAYLAEKYGTKAAKS